MPSWMISATALVIHLSAVGSIDARSLAFDHYLGALSKTHPDTVSETYLGSRLISAFIDTDGDRRFDYFVTFNDAGTQIDMIYPRDTDIDEYRRSTSGNIYEKVRPKNVRASADLEALSAATKRIPSLELLQKLGSLPGEHSESWIASVALRNPSQHSEATIAEAYRLLRDGKLTMQCAFILTGFGNEGLKKLGAAMRETEDPKATRDAALFLSSIGAAAIICTPDLVNTLEKDWINTRHLALSALLKISKASPDAVKPYLDILRHYSSHADEDIRRYAGLIVKQVEGAD